MTSTSSAPLEWKWDEGAAEAWPAEPGTWYVSWQIAAPLLGGELNEVVRELEGQEGATRLVHLSRAGDYADLRIARDLGFRAEGSERRLEDDQVAHYWRSARLTGEDTPLAGRIDGARPAHLVGEFHDVYDMPNLVAKRAEPTVDYPRLGLRMDLIKEEFAELCGAVYGAGAEEALLDTFPNLPDDGLRDVVEAADALGDLTYVIYGMALESGIDLESVLGEIHRSNLSKLMPDGSVRRRFDGKILKGPDFSPPNIAGAMKAQDSSR